MEWGGERAVIVFSMGAPRQRLMGWFLRDSGIPVELTDSREQTLALVASGLYPLLIINTTAEPSRIASVVCEMRAADARMRIIVLHEGCHREDEADIPADICIHDVSDPDRLVEAVRAALRDEVPDEEPHLAAEELV